MELDETAQTLHLPHSIQFDEVDAPQKKVHSQIQELQDLVIARYAKTTAWPSTSFWSVVIGGASTKSFENQ